MSLYLKQKFNRNKEIIVVVISSLTSLGVALYLGNNNIRSTEKQINNQLIILEKQIESQKNLLQDQAINEQKRTEERNNNELERTKLLHSNSMEVLKRQKLDEIDLFRGKKSTELKIETDRAANYITSDIVLKIYALKDIATSNPSTFLQKDSIFDPMLREQKN